MIWFDNLRAYGTPNYYVQKLFSLYPGTHVLPVQLANNPMLDEKSAALNVSTTIDQVANEVILKAVNAGSAPLTATLNLKGVKGGGDMKVITLSSGNLDDENTIEEPNKVAPIETTEKVAGASFDYAFKPYAFTILRIPVGQ